MYVLVDYDNYEIENAISARKGFDFFADKVLTSIRGSYQEEFHRIEIRLYSGWHIGNNLTRKAQDVARKLTNFPKIFSYKDSEHKDKKFGANVKLALSLLAAPAKPICNTLRTRKLNLNKSCVHPKTLGCSTNDCPMSTFYNVLKSNKCTNPGCSVSVDNVIQNKEQKLVDSMIIVDALHISATTKDPICIVSSDDDMIPAIISILAQGGTVIHIHTKSGRRIDRNYISGLTGTYFQFDL